MRLCFLHSDITLVGGIERVTSVLANYFITSDNINIDIVSQFQTNGAPNYPFADGIHILSSTYKCNFLGADNKQ